jgi:hypothetical protein
VIVAAFGQAVGVDLLRFDEAALSVQLVDGDGDIAAGLAHDQHALAFMDDRALAFEELLEVDDRQQVAADVGHAEHPRLRAGTGVTGGSGRISTTSSKPDARRCVPMR